MKIFFTILIMLWCSGAWGADYYVSESSTPGSPYNSCATGAANVSTIVALNLEGDDNVIFCAATPGGTWTHIGRILLTADDFGSDGHPLTFKARTGDYVTIQADQSKSETSAFLMQNAANDYVTLQDLTLTGGTTSNVLINANGIDNFNIKDVVSGSGGSNALSSNGKTINNWVVDGLTASGHTSTGVTLIGESSTNIEIKNSTITGGTIAFYLKNIENLTLTSNETISNTSYPCLIESITGYLNMTNIVSPPGDADTEVIYVKNTTVTNSLFTGIQSALWFDNTNGITIEESILGNSVGSCVFSTNASHDIIIRKNVISSCASDGISSNGAYNMSYLNNNISNIGSAGTATSGDCVTGHGTDYNILIYGNILHNCKNTAMAFIQNTSGWAYNNIFYSNGDADHVIRGNIYLNNNDVNPTTSTSWTIKNNIAMDAYTGKELWLSATDKTMLDAGTLILNNNVYWNSSDTDGSDIITLDGGSSATSWATYHASYEANSLYADPLFTDAAGGNFFPLSTSPAMGRGQCPFVHGDGDQYDMAGNLIWSDTTDAPVGPGADGWEIGAYQRYQAYMLHNQD